MGSRKLRRNVLLLATVALLITLSAGAASAAVLFGNGTPNMLSGKERADVIYGRGDNDFLYGRGGNDLLYGGGGRDYISGDGGRDVLYGGYGRDQIYADDGVRDLIFCGGGTDTVFADRIDFVVGCEIEGSAVLKGGVLATFAVGREHFQVWVTNEQSIWDLYQLKRGESTANIPNGRILKGSGRAAHNVPYSWHLSPTDTTMADFTTEVCDAQPSYVEEHLGEFINNVERYCPWQARLVKLRNYTGKKITPPNNEETPPPSIFPDEG